MIQEPHLSRVKLFSPSGNLKFIFKKKTMKSEFYFFFSAGDWIRAMFMLGKDFSDESHAQSLTGGF